jgi:hypothetical protein
MVEWGYNSYGQASVPNAINDAVGIAAGGNHSLALLGDGRPSVVQQPRSQTVYAGSNVALAVTTVSPSTLNYQWQFNGTNIDGATNSVLVLTNVPLNAEGAYRVVVSNVFGSITSLDANLFLLRSSPQFEPSLQLNALGATLRVRGLSGHGPLIIDASSDLKIWLPLLTNAPMPGTLEWLDSSATNFPARFYRAIEQ